MPRLPDLSPMPVTYTLNYPLTSRDKKPTILLKRQNSTSNMVPILKFKQDSVLLEDTLDDKRLKVRANRLSLNNKYAQIYRNMYTEDNGDLVKAFTSIRQKIHASNKSLMKNANSIMMHSARDLLSQSN